MKKSIITIAVAAMFTMSFGESEASWVFGKHNAETTQGIMRDYNGSIDKELKESLTHIKNAQHALKGSKVKSFIKQFIEANDGLIEDVAVAKLGPCIQKCRTLLQSMTSDPKFQMDREFLANVANQILETLTPKVQPRIANQMNMTPAGRLVIEFFNVASELRQITSGGSIMPVATTNYVSPAVYNPYAAPAPVAAAPVAAAPVAAPVAARGR